MKHPNWKTRGATPTPSTEAFVECPVCSGQLSEYCDHCENGQVTPEQEQALELAQESRSTPKVG